MQTLESFRLPYRLSLSLMEFYAAPTLAEQAILLEHARKSQTIPGEELASLLDEVEGMTSELNSPGLRP